MEDPRTLVAAAAILLYALLSRRLDKWWISMPAAMTLLGLVLGPVGLGVIGAGIQSEVVRVTAEITLALMLFHDAVRIDIAALRRGYVVPLRLLGIGLPLMILIGTGVAWGMVPALGLIGAALVGTMLAPTDAALGEAVVSDTRLPVRIRQGLNVESGLNDGLSVPVFLVLLATAADPTGWHTGALASQLGLQIGAGVLAGLVVGGGSGLLFKLAASRGEMTDVWKRLGVLAIAIGCFVLAAVIGGSGFIAAFVGGLAFGLASGARSPEVNGFAGYVGTVFDALSFLLLGVVLVPYALQNMTWTTVAYAVVSLVVIRLVSVAIAMLGSGARWQTVAFMGWFGPRGLATLVFTVLLVDAAVPNAHTIASVAIAGVVLSVFAHGLSAPPLVSAYSRWWDRLSHAEGKPMEAAHVHQDPTRSGNVPGTQA